ncbi:MAG: SUMF1/EgtB/PvdO family nonheme iron enzyme, partial [Candidatus Thiodiazotropha sp. (ex Notomyrtea botanica)]|nr:SUMF1/EgtB/PvdO family nonheme iron enzyme [Candidatus Thiodiazotropha sp. (ex Notomyrtea botanica)]
LSRLKRELVRSDVQLALIGPGWLTASDDEGRPRLGMPGDIVTLEIMAALERGVTVIPVVLQDAKVPAEKHLPPDLRRLVLRQGVRLEQVTDGEAVNRLVGMLEELPERVPEVVGGYFHLEGHIGKTRYTDSYMAVPESTARSLDTYVVHLLRQGSDADTKDWLERRCTLWQSVSHSNVAVIDAHSDCRASSNTPFYAVSACRGGQRLDSVIKENGGLDRRRIVEILAVASSICKAAHKQGVLLQTLEPSHFWMDASNMPHYEGFDAAASLDERATSDARRSQMYCLNPEHLSPEAGTRKGGRAVDIYALGMLLKAMELKPGHALVTLTGQERRAPWSAFAYHCLCVDPYGRFLDPDHFRYYLMRCLDWQELVPEMISHDAYHNAAAENNVSTSYPTTNAIGRLPVTNIEYEHFCIETDYPLYAPDTNARRIARRVQGPFCPAVNVNLNDAEKYCEWLTKKTGTKYRLPTELEWMTAASGSEKGFANSGCREPVANCANRFGGPTVAGAFGHTQSNIGCRDMLGNVWEWCSDSLGKGTGLRIMKGGSYSCSVSTLSIAGRKTAVRTHRASNVGFRVLREG